MTLTRRTLLRRTGALAVATSALGVGGCTRMLSEMSGVGADTIVDTGIPFGSDPRHCLDLYRPTALDDDTPVALFLYGGSWRWGSRGRYGFVGHALASRGIAVAIADYRLYPQVRFPAFNRDAAAAVAWLARNGAGYGLNAPIHVVGHSAGAHIAAMLALDPAYLEAEGQDAGAIASVVGIAGPYAIRPAEIGCISDIFPPAAEQDTARPVALSRAGVVPMLLLHGADDNIVAPENTLAMAAALKAHGNAVAVRVYEKLGHKDIVLALSRPLQSVGPVLDDVSRFIKNGGVEAVSLDAAL